ncbi:MAG: hypothetical protein J5J00_08225 [Deltaproteobacteria bacterium]|nr:hypothetical protein [Deltaproteobacteria bacterium]
MVNSRRRAISSTQARAFGMAGASTMFFAVIVLPMLFLILTLALDLSLFFTIGQKSQTLADEAAMYAFRFMPDVDRARSAGESYALHTAKQRSIPIDSVQTLNSSDQLSILMNGRAPMHFARWFGFDGGLPVQARASVRGQPQDVFVAVDVSSRLAPDAITGTAWGTEVQWPAATFFAHEMPIYIPDPYDAGRTVRVNERLLTQQCFNPIFSAEKAAAAEVFDYFSRFSLNGIGLGFFPGEFFTLDVAREVLPGGRRKTEEQLKGEADFDALSGTQTSSTLMCAAVAQQEHSHDSYKFPVPPVVDPVNVGSALSFNQDYAAWARAKEVIWSRAASQRATYSIESILSEITGRLLSAAPQPKRGGLAHRASKLGVIFLSGMPHEGTARFPEPAAAEAISRALLKASEAAAEAKVNMRLYLVLMQYEAWQPYQHQELEQLAALFAQLEYGDDSSSLRIRTLVAADPNELQDAIAKVMVLDEKSVFIAE